MRYRNRKLEEVVGWEDKEGRGNGGDGREAEKMDKQARREEESKGKEENYKQEQMEKMKSGRRKEN
jgi:hypothetical protein